MTNPATAHRLLARDGTSIAWHSYAGVTDPIVLTTGLGTTPNFWNPLIEAISPPHPVARWDYRGHGGSEVPSSDDYAIATQADDLARVTEAFVTSGADAGTNPPAVHIGFSMGVTVVLELYRRRPDLVRALILVAGGANHPYAASSLLQLPGVHVALEAGLRAAAPVFPRLSPLIRRSSRSKALFTVGRALGALGERAPREELEHFFRAVGDMDAHAYWSTLRGLFASRASDVLPTINVPVLIVAPGHDLMAPDVDLTQLRDTIPGAQWLRVPGTGHAVLLEAGDVVGEAVNRFVRTLP